MHTLIFYHHNCLDGSMSACILKTVHPLALAVPLTYGWQLPESLALIKPKRIIFTDITPKKDMVKALLDLGVQEIIILDHHEGAVGHMQELHGSLERLEMIRAQPGFAYDNHQSHGKVCLFNGIDMQYKNTRIEVKTECCTNDPRDIDPFEKLFSDESEGQLTQALQDGFKEDSDSSTLVSLSTYYTKEASGVGLAAGYVKHSGLLSDEVIHCTGFKYFMGVAETAQRYDLGLHQGELYTKETLLNTFFHDIRRRNERNNLAILEGFRSAQTHEQALGALMALDRICQAEVFEAIRLFHTDKEKMNRIKKMEKDLRGQELMVDVLEVQSFWLSPFRVIFGAFDNDLRNETAYLASKKDPWLIGIVRVGESLNDNPSPEVRVSLRAGSQVKHFSRRDLPRFQINFSDLAQFAFHGAGHTNAAGGKAPEGEVVNLFAKALLELRTLKGKEFSAKFASIDNAKKEILELRPFNGARIIHHRMSWADYIDYYHAVEPGKNEQELTANLGSHKVSTITTQSFDNPELFLRAFSKNQV